LNIDLFNCVLANFAHYFGPGPDKHILLSIDQVGWYTSDKVVLPEGLRLVFLPSYSPELQPAERLWPILDEPIANRVFDTIDELEQMLCAPVGISDRTLQTEGCDRCKSATSTTR
jgi:transposase